MPKKKKRKLKKSFRILRAIYRTVVVLSAIVVIVYVALQFAVKPPDQALAYGEGDEVEETDPNHKERKPLCFTFLLAAKDGESGNADTIMVAMYDIPGQSVGLVSIPRDTAVYTERSTPKINSAYPLGVDRLRDEISDLLGIPIDFYVTLDMDAFVQIVDAVGGVTFDVPVEMYYHDPVQNLTIRYMPGVQPLNGQQALEVVRFRNNADGTGYAIPDVGRTKTQQKMLKAIAGELIAWNNLTKVKQFVEIFNGNVNTDIGMTDMLYFAGQAVTLDVENNVKSATMPGDGTKTVRNHRSCYVFYPEEALAIINEMINPYTEEMTLDDVHFYPLEEEGEAAA